MSPVPGLDDLAALFEHEPEPAYEADAADWREKWPHTTVVFRAARGGHEVVFEISPGFGEVAITVTDAQNELIELELGGVQTVEVERLHGAEDVHVRFGDDRVDPLRLRLRPTVSLHWDAFRTT